MFFASYSYSFKIEFVLLYGLDGDVAAGVFDAVYGVEVLEDFIQVISLHDDEAVDFSRDSERSGDCEFLDSFVYVDSFYG